MIPKAGLLVVLGIFFPLNAISFSVGPNIVTLDYVANKYEYILQVNVISSDVAGFYFNGIKHNCGIIYHAEILDSVGEPLEETEIIFSSELPMKTNINYLIFVTEQPQFLRRKDFFVEDKDSYLLSSEMKNCVKELPLLNASGVAFEFDQVMGETVSNIIYDSPNVILPEELDLHQRSYVLCPYREKPKKCRAQLVEQLTDWSDLRARLASRKLREPSE